MTSGGRERRTNWESVTLIRIYLNITWTQQGLRIGYFDFLRYTAGDISPNFPRYTAGDISPNFPGTQQALFSKFPRYTAGFIFRIFPGTQQAIFLRIFPGTQQAIFLRIFPGTQQVLYVTNHHKIVGIQQVLKLKNVTYGEMLKPTV